MLCEHVSNSVPELCYFQKKNTRSTHVARVFRLSDVSQSIGFSALDVNYECVFYVSQR